MKVEYDRNGRKIEDSELYRLGSCLALQHGRVTHRIYLTRGQWELLAKSARTAVEDIDERTLIAKKGRAR